MDNRSMDYDTLDCIIEGSREPGDLSLDFLKDITHKFSDELKIAGGGFGEVYKGIYRNRCIAVKKITTNIHTIDDKLFRAEVMNLMKVKHPNVVRFLGFCSHTVGKTIKLEGSDERAFAQMQERLLCFEYISNGTLDKHITDELRGLEWDQRYKIVLGICEGLQHLHSEVNIIHMDLKPANILLDEHLEPKITDFGLARNDKSTHTMGQRFISRGYAAPEYEHHGKMSKRSDIYSLGVIIIQLVTGRRATPNKENVLRRWSHRWNRTHVHTQLQYQQVIKCIEIAVSCMNQDPKDRPFISNIIRNLSDIGSTSHANESAVDNISPYYQEDMLLIEPLELHFPFEINKQISRSLQLINGTGSYIAFNIETPQHFWIQPNKGIVPPQSPQFKCTVTVIMQLQEKALQDMKHDDEFILESTKVKEGLRAEYITKDMFKEEVGKVVDKVNLTVVYESMQSQDLDQLGTENLNRSAEAVSKESRQTQITTVEEEKLEKKGRCKIENCFGEVVNNYKLDKMTRYMGKPKTLEDRAREAWNLVNEDDKDAKASKYVDALKAAYGTGQSTLCLVYNATGDTLYLVAEHDWYGYIGSAPYPTEIGNGQWAAFHHVHQSGEPSGSVAAVVYRGKNTDGQDQDYLLAWSTPWGMWYRNKAYCEIGGVDYFKRRWGNTYEKLINSDYSSNVKSNGCEIEAKIGTGDSPKYTARITSR